MDTYLSFEKYVCFSYEEARVSRARKITFEYNVAEIFFFLIVIQEFLKFHYIVRFYKKCFYKKQY